MELAATASATPFALWLNTFFSGYDYAILDFMNTLAINAGNILTPIMKAITFIGEKGIIFFLLAFILILSPKTRKIGVCVFGAVSCGFLVNNLILKEIVARVRPFLDEANVHYRDYRSFWDAVGSPAENGFSFPSGHVTCAAAGMFALILCKGKKMIIPSVIWVDLMMVSRNYLMAHYPSDVLFALVIGIFSALVAWGISAFIFNWLDDNGDYRFCNWILTATLPLSFDDLKDRASDSLGSIKDKAADSFVSIKDKASNISMPDIDIKGAGKKLMGDKFPAREAPKKTSAKKEAPKKEAPKKDASRKDAAGWNARWDEYQKSKHPQSDDADTASADDDVKVFSGSKKAVHISDDDDLAAVPDTEKVILDAPTKAIKNGKAELDLDNWDDLSKFVESDLESILSETPRTEKSSRSHGGAYKGRHVK